MIPEEVEQLPSETGRVRGGFFTRTLDLVVRSGGMGDLAGLPLMGLALTDWFMDLLPWAALGRDSLAWPAFDTDILTLVLILCLLMEDLR